MPPSASDKSSRADRPRLKRLPLWAVMAALGVVSGVVGVRVFAPERTCPAIGYSSALVVTLTGDLSGMAHLQVRDGDRWQPPYPAGPDATTPAIPASRDGDTWTFTLFYPSGPIALRALDDGGAVLASTEVDVDWVRVGGSAACGGPMEGRVSWTT